MSIPDGLRYSSDHEWISIDGNRARMGITDYAQDALGDVVFVQVPTLGTAVTVGDTIAWANEDIVIHTVTGDTARWDSGDLANGKRYKVVASKKGTLTYHCELHPNMKGTLLVQ